MNAGQSIGFTLMTIALVGLTALALSKVIKSFQPVPNLVLPQVVSSVREAPTHVKDCVWKDPCDWTPTDEFMERVAALMRQHRTQAWLLKQCRTGVLSATD